MMLDSAIKASIDEGFSLLPFKMDSQPARVMTYAIGYQESEFKHRRQVTNSGKEDGPATSFWQMERTGGVIGVLTHPASKALAEAVCRFRNVEPRAREVWTAMIYDDVLGAAFARLLLWTDHRSLPAVPDQISFLTPEDSRSWQYYERNWRPGKPHPKKWKASYSNALREVGL